MEVTVGSFATSIALIVGLSYAWKVFNWVWLRPKKLEALLRRQGFSGNCYRLLFGDLKEIGEMLAEAKLKTIKVSDDILPRLLPFHTHILDKYGRNSFTWIGPYLAVNIMEPKLVHEILHKHNIFKKQLPSVLKKVLFTGLIGYEDEKWAKHRRIMNPAFFAEKLKRMLPAMRLSCSEMISKWEEGLMIAENDSSFELDVSPHLRNLASDVIARTAFGSSYGEGRKIFELLQEQADIVGRLFLALSFYLPGGRFLPTKENKRMKEISNKVQALVTDLVNKREKAMKSGESTVDEDDDLLGMLLKSNLNEIKQHQNKKDAGMTIEDVVDECKLFYFAGQETTASLLVWAMILLGHHTNWQARAREEVWQVFGKNNQPDYDGLSHLKAVTMILNEVLRLYPPVVSLSRVVQRGATIGNIILPEGALILLPIIFAHHDRQIWGEDAKEFNPERFSEGVAKVTKNQADFIPFSWGPRTCIANNYAMMEAKIALAMILQRFSFELSSSYTHAPLTVITVIPEHGAQMRLRKL